MKSKIQYKLLWLPVGLAICFFTFMLYGIISIPNYFIGIGIISLPFLVTVFVYYLERKTTYKWTFKIFQRPKRIGDNTRMIISRPREHHLHQPKTKYYCYSEIFHGFREFNELLATNFRDRPWYKLEYDENNNIIYFENSEGIRISVPRDER